MFFQLPLRVFLFSLIALDVLANASPTENTNGYRLARGLPPLPPREFGRKKPGFEPTPVLRTRASPSPSSVVRYTGRLQVRSSDGSTIGYVQDKLGLPVSGGSDLTISLTASSTRKKQLNIVATATSFPSPFYLGALIQGSGNATIGTGSSTFLQFSNVQKTDALSQPVRVKSGNGDTSVESAIWAINSTTKELTAQYVNPDGSLPNTILVYNDANDRLYFVGDTAAFNASVAQVNLFVVN
ncbi:hypothetical protein F5890DRAFT_1475372 [Lentinula detonsa]|uniref:Uncharacterized protein n=1 Tax=Lentinula detonsa TaxID=2804962 RepID=A0AA38PX55_9AGAR|nr:hypothetical protein F5890DRAFT_1475372 [Lentinula detonsa]